MASRCYGRRARIPMSPCSFSPRAAPLPTGSLGSRAAEVYRDSPRRRLPRGHREVKRLGLGGQIAIAVAAVALLVGSVLALGTLVLGGRSFSQIMVEHGESVASAEAMFRDSVVV